MPAEFVITDGVIEIDLLGPETGFHSANWNPAIAQYKGGGVWRDSPYADGRRLVDKRFANAIETIQLKERDIDQDAAIYTMQEARRLFEMGSSYWSTTWQNTPVYIRAKASRETNTRYAIIHTASIPEDDYPYGPPFLQPGCAAVFDDLTLIIERGPWLANIPGTGTCVAITGSQVYEEGPPWYLEYDGLTSRILIPDNAAIQNLHNGDLTAEAWVRADGWGESNSGMIFWKRDNGGVGGWYLGIDLARGLVADGDWVTANAISRSGLDDFTPDGEWVHIAATFPTFATQQWWLYVNGVQVSYTLQQAGQGAIVNDVGDDLYIGNDVNFLHTWDGDIGWARLSSNIRYGADFTPPPRCELPVIDANTIGQWVGVEHAGATIDNQEGTAAIDGTQTNCTFDGCVPEYGRDIETCLDEVYIANKHNQANLTHIFTWSAANGFSVNLATAPLPYDLIDIAGAAPAVNDYVVFGIDTTLADSGPFASLVFDIGTAIAGITVDWEYWNGAWVGLTVKDNTDTVVPFDNTGVNSVHWEPPAGWVTVAVNGVTGYWVRALVIAAPGAHVAPTQQNRDVYSIVWPYIDIDSAQVLGGVTALSKIKAHNQSSRDPVRAWQIARMIVGLRSLNRGANFTAYLNASAEQNPAGITVTLGGNTAPANDPSAPTGWRATYSPAGVSAQSEEVTFSLDETISTHFYGKFHAYVRARQFNGVAGEIGVALRMDVGDGGTTVILFQTDEVFFSSITDTFVLMDMGQITIPMSSVNEGEIWAELDLIVLLSNSSGVPGDAYVYDLILIPVDEWAGDYLGNFDVTTDYSLIVDSIGRPKTPIRANVVVESNSQFAAPYRSITSGPSVLQANAAQRLWFLFVSNTDDSPANPLLSQSIQMFKVQRYLSMRGER